MKKVITILVTIVFMLSFASSANAQITKDQYYARSTLSGKELELYDAWYDLFEDGTTIIYDLHGVDESRAKQIANYVWRDAPELINGDGFYSEEESAELLEQIKDKTEKVVSGIPSNATEYETVEYLYNWTVDNIMYYLGYTPQEESESQSIVGGLIRGRAVCAGISRALQYLLYQVDIPCYVVVGTFNDGAHGWNLIHIDGEWYYADPTEDYFHKDGFLMTTADLPKYNLWLEPEENPPLPETPTIIPLEYREPEPTPTPTSTPQTTAAPVVASAEPTPDITQEPETMSEDTGKPALWVMAAGAVAVILLLLARRKKKA